MYTTSSQSDPIQILKFGVSAEPDTDTVTTIRTKLNY